MIAVYFKTEIYLSFITYTYKKCSFCGIHLVAVHLITFDKGVPSTTPNFISYASSCLVASGDGTYKIWCG